MDFNRYKHHLLDYLRIHGIEADLGQVRSCPWHEDSKPSFSVFTGDDGYPAFNCFGCGRAGDIYNAVEFCEGETDRARQFEIIERRFGGVARTFTPAPKPKPTAFTPDPAALAKLTAWLESNHKANEYIRGYFDQRALLKSGGKEYHYPTELFPEILSYFYWWPGRNAAERALGKSVLFAAGIPWNKDDEKEEMQKRRLAWYHAGILAKSPEGFKLFFIADGKSQQRNPRAGVSYFPIPGELPQGGTVVLMEGEIDAIMCRAAGIPNTFSMGGKSGLTKDRIAKYIVPKKLDEIILFADNDADGGGQKKFGLLPITPQDHIRETVPDNLRKMGYDGAIRLTVLPDGCGFKDPDDAIRNGRTDLVREAIANAQDYIPPEKNAATPPKTRTQTNFRDLTEWENVPAKFLRSFLKKIKYDELTDDEKRRAVTAAIKACKDESAPADISIWSESEFTAKKIIELKKEDGTPFDLIDIGSQHGATPYLVAKLEEILVPAAEILNAIDPIPTILPIDYETLADTKEFGSFLRYCDHAFASYALARALKGKLIYIDHEEANYVYTGNYWTRIPSIATEAHAALINTLLCYLRKNPKEKKPVLDCIKTIGSNSFRQKLSNDLNKKEAQFYHDEKKQPILFDSYPVRETITLLDGVLDFSGDKIVFRKGKPEEYRLVPLPYTVRQIRQAAHPETFLRAIDLDFDEPSKETLEKNPQRTKDTFLYALSLIPSRNVAKNYVIFMTGTGGAGKSTIMTVINDVFGYENVAQLNAKVLISNKKSFDNENGPSPEIAELEGKMLAVTMEIPEDGKLNSDQLKRLTGGDLISARQLRQGLHKFRPTAQIAIVGNSLPAFYKHDSGIIRRLLVFHFNVEHAKRARSKEHKARYKGIPSNSAKLVEQIRAEAPGIIRLLAEKYIELKRDNDLNIPTSQECENAKSQYIEAQNKETDEFYEQCVKFTPGDDNAFIFATDMYHCYLNFKGYQEGSAEALKQKQFTFYLKKDHPELCGGNWCQRRRDGGKPEWGFKFVSFTDEGKEYLQPDSASGLPFTPPPQPEMPLDDPFAAPDTPPEYPPPTDEDGNEIDIY
ncbi:toprim domain-containing protein [bacterium]|nr:toprim domain-containing protein [bacterium]